MDKDFLLDEEEFKKFGLEVKNEFEEEFSMNDITVSEDLIARTMTALGLKNAREAEKDSINSGDDTKKNDIIPKKSEKSVENARVTDISRSKGSRKAVKWVSGIAAALLIGVVGLVLFKLGSGTLKSSDKAESATANSSSSLSYSSSASASDSYVTNDFEASEPNTYRYEYDEKETNSLKEETSATQSSQSLQSSSMAADSAPECTADNSEAFDEEYYDKIGKTAFENSDSSLKMPDGDYSGISAEINRSYLSNNIGKLKSELELKIEEALDNGVSGTEIADMIRESEGYDSIIEAGDDIAPVIREMLRASNDRAEQFIFNTILNDLEDK